MSSTRKVRNVNKCYAKINEDWHDKDAANVHKSKVRKKKLSDMLGSQWSKDELECFYGAYRKYGKDWRKVAGSVRDRTSEMVEALYNMNRAYLSLPEGTATAAGLIAMMTDHYNILDESNSDRESNDSPETSRKPLKRGRAKFQSLSKTSDTCYPDLLQSQPASSSYGCLSLLKKKRSGGNRPRAVGKRTPRVPVASMYHRDDKINSAKRQAKPDANNGDDEIKFKPDLVITEKGLSDLAIHYLSKAGVSAIRRLRKTDNNRIAKACGAVIVNRPEELQESDVGTGAGLFEVKKIGDEFFAFIVDCKDPKACTVLLRGASKDVLNEVERNLQDAMSVARNILKNPKLLPGGGATELTVSATLKQNSSSVEGVEKWPYEAAALAFEAIPRTLAQNCGLNVIRTMTQLQGKHANGENAWVGIDGRSGDIVDMKERKIWDSYSVKAQTFKTAIEAACMLLRIDDIVSGIKKKQAPGASSAPKQPQIEQEGDADNEQMIPE